MNQNVIDMEMDIDIYNTILTLRRVRRRIYENRVNTVSTSTIRNFNFGVDLDLDLSINSLMNMYRNLDTFIGDNIGNVDVEYEDVKITLTEDEFNNLKNNTDKYEKDCNICLESMNNDSSKTELLCKHVYHTECIKKWLLKSSSKCPCCRMEMRKNE